MNEFDIYRHDDELMMVTLRPIETIKIASKTPKIQQFLRLFSLPCSSLTLSFFSVWMSLCRVDGLDVFVWISYTCYALFCICEYLKSNQLTLNINYNLSMSLVHYVNHTIWNIYVNQMNDACWVTFFKYKIMNRCRMYLLHAEKGKGDREGYTYCSCI